MNIPIAFVCGSLLFWQAIPAPAEAPPVQIRRGNPWTTTFGGLDTKLRLQVKAEEAFDGVLRWRHAYEHRTLRSGESAVRVAAGESATVEIPLAIPSVKSGVVLATRFSANLAQAGAAEPVAKFSQPLTIFSQNVFDERISWLKEFHIQVFDPVGRTAEQLQEAEVPFARVRNLNALDDVSTKLLIVGEGVSFRTYRNLPDVLQEIAARGVGVLCLAPREGQFPFPSATSTPKPRSVNLSDESIIRKIDKRLDDRQWQTVKTIAPNRFVMRPVRSGVRLEIQEVANGWPWLEVEYPSDGRLIYCGFSLIEHWDAGPTPRYLLLGLIERLAGDPQTQPES